MRILLKLVLDCDADAAWRALHSPATLAELYGPLVDVRAGVPLPETWGSGDAAILHLSTAGLPLGSQLVDITDLRRYERDETVRILRDSGLPLTGPLSALDFWDHRMAVSPAPRSPGRTLWREQLTIAGPAAPALWPVLWATWQWRGRRLRRLAPTWAHDPVTTPRAPRSA